MTSDTSAFEAQRRRIIHGAASALASIDPDGESYEIKLAELESYLAQQPDRKDSVRPQPPRWPARADGSGAGAAFWRARWTKQKGRIAKGTRCPGPCLRRTVSWRKQYPLLGCPRVIRLSRADDASLATAVQSGRFTEATLRVGNSARSRRPQVHALRASQSQSVSGTAAGAPARVQTGRGGFRGRHAHERSRRSRRGCRPVCRAVARGQPLALLELVCASRPLEQGWRCSR